MSKYRDEMMERAEVRRRLEEKEETDATIAELRAQLHVYDALAGDGDRITGEKLRARIIELQEKSAVLRTTRIGKLMKDYEVSEQRRVELAQKLAAELETGQSRCLGCVGKDRYIELLENEVRYHVSKSAQNGPMACNSEQADHLASQAIEELRKEAKEDK